MITETLLIDLDDIIERMGTFDANIEPKKVRYAVLIGQDKYTRPILGDKLYFDILDKYENETMTPEYDILYKYIVQQLTTRAVIRLIDELQVQVTNKGLQKRNSDYSTSADKNDTFQKINQYFDDAEFYEDRLWQFLKNNKEDYPLWEEKSDDINKNNPNDFNIYDIIFV